VWSLETQNVYYQPPEQSSHTKTLLKGKQDLESSPKRDKYPSMDIIGPYFFNLLEEKGGWWRGGGQGAQEVDGLWKKTRVQLGIW